MYLHNIVIQNVGAIEKLHLKLPFNDNGNPKPVFIVGENGSGKSILLSHITDSFIEFAKQPFRNIVNATHTNPSPYYKISGYINQRNYKEYGISYLKYKSLDGQQYYEYVDKSGILTMDDALKITNNLWVDNNISWSSEENVKWVTQNTESLSNVFKNNINCYFPPSRHEPAHWFNSSFKKGESIDQYSPYIGIFDRDIIIENALNLNKNWILDVFLDSRAELEEYIGDNGETLFRSLSNLNAISLLNRTKLNIEKVISAILSKPIKLNLNLRRQSFSRISILDAESNQVLLPSLEHLSTGQNAILNIFCTIIRYADMVDVNHSMNTENISGIVVIDEIDLHLHTILQKEVLPNLILLFPKIQFIISTHSPYLLLGMHEQIGEENIFIYDMTQSTEINIERFSEFNQAFDYYKNTIKFENEVKKEIDKSNKPIIITEGKTDARILKVAWEKLYPDQEMFFEVIPSGVQLEESNRTGSAETVRRTLEFISNLPSENIIGLFDNDREGNERFKGLSKHSFESYNITKDVRKHLSKNIFAILLPVPKSREFFVTGDNMTQRYFEIEHYFSDEVLKEHNMIANYILGTDVFEIGKNKDEFSKAIESLDASSFQDFILLFDRLKTINSV